MERPARLHVLPQFRILSFCLALILSPSFGAPLLAQPSSTPKKLKQGTITTLQQITTNDSKIRDAIADAIEAISRSLTDKKDNRSLFLDDWRILPPSTGSRVFHEERDAVKELLSV
jgi:hypothetical protein